MCIVKCWNDGIFFLMYIFLQVLDIFSEEAFKHLIFPTVILSFAPGMLTEKEP